MSHNDKLRIVLLEDNDIVREVLHASLTHRGYDVYAFAEPTICPLQLSPACRCTENQVCTDVILTDLDMPGMDGFQFVENLKRKNCKCGHVAIMSAWISPMDVHRARQLGCEIFEKPFRMENFIKWVRSVQQVLEPSRELCNWFQNPKKDTP